MNKKIIFFIIASLIVLGISYWLWSYSGLLSKNNYSDIAVEFHGMVFDVLLFGIVLTIYEAYREKRDQIKKYREDLEDFQGWDEKEAMYRNLGTIRRLNRLGVSNINLFGNYFEGARMFMVDLKFASLWKTNFQKATLRQSDLNGAWFRDTNLKMANLLGTKIQYAKITKADFQEALIIGTDFSNSKIDFVIMRWAVVAKANFKNSNIEFIDLRGALISDINFTGAKIKSIVAYEYQKKAFEKLNEYEKIKDCITWKENPDPEIILNENPELFVGFKGELFDDFKYDFVNPFHFIPKKKKGKDGIKKSREILVGPKGGNYYYSLSGKKVYLKKTMEK